MTQEEEGKRQEISSRRQQLLAQEELQEKNYPIHFSSLKI